MLGIIWRLHEERTAVDLGVAHLPGPVCVSDMAATADEAYRVVDVITNPPGSIVEALVKVAPERLTVVAR